MPFDASFAHHLSLVANLEKQFEQIKGIGQIDKPELREKVAGGYCFGACMTWLTLALAKERPTVINHEDPLLVKRMAKGSVKYDKAHRDAAVRLRDRAQMGSSEQYGQIEDRRQKEWDTAEDEAYTALEQENQKWGDRFSKAADHPVLQKKMAEVRIRLDAALKEAETEIKARKLQAQTLAQGKADRAVQAVSAEVTPEQVVKVAWGILKRKEATSYTGALTPVKHVEGGHLKTVGDFVCELLQAPAFTDGRGMIVSFTTGTSGTVGKQPSVFEPAGHAVAMHRLDKDNYWLFEPNLGVYRLKSRQLLIYALVLILADGYNKRHLGDDSAIVFCKTSETFPAQDGAATNAGILVERDWVRETMAGRLEALAKKAYEAGMKALTIAKEKGDDQKAVKAANEEMRDAFLHARLTQSAVKPSEVMERLKSDASFLRGGGRVADTGLHALHAALGEIF